MRLASARPRANTTTRASSPSRTAFWNPFTPTCSKILWEDSIAIALIALIDIRSTSSWNPFARGRPCRSAMADPRIPSTSRWNSWRISDGGTPQGLPHDGDVCEHVFPDRPTARPGGHGDPGRRADDPRIPEENSREAERHRDNLRDPHPPRPRRRPRGNEARGPRRE